MCRSRRKLSNAYLLAKFGFDTAENESGLPPPQPPRTSLVKFARSLSTDRPGSHDSPDPRRVPGEIQPFFFVILGTAADENHHRVMIVRRDRTEELWILLSHDVLFFSLRSVKNLYA